MASSDIPDARSVTDSRENTSARLPASEEAQLSPTNGVSNSVSSVAIDRGILDRGLPNLAGTRPSAPAAMASSVVSTDAAVSDVDAMLRVKTGDESAFAYLVQKYRRPMVGFMYRLCHNPSTAEELAQEVFLRVYRSRTSYEPSAKFTTWLYRIATNLAVNHARDTRHERPENTLRLDEPDQETGNTPDLADDSLSAEEQILEAGAAGGHPQQSERAARAPARGGHHAQVSADGLPPDCERAEAERVRHQIVAVPRL